MLHDESEAYRTLEAAPSNVCDVGHFSHGVVSHMSHAQEELEFRQHQRGLVSGSDIAAAAAQASGCLRLRAGMNGPWKNSCSGGQSHDGPRRCRLRMSRCQMLQRRN